jgi:hypothetical protein
MSFDVDLVRFGQKTVPHRFHSGEDLEQTLLRYVHLYNSTLRQSVLNGRTPIDALKDLQRQKPEMLKNRVYHHVGSDTYARFTYHA